MRYQQSKERRAVILMVVLSLLTLFAVVGITFVLYADAEAAAARVSREAETAQRAEVSPEQALAFFLSQLIYDASDTTGYGSGLRGHSLARTMYGYNYAPGVNLVPFSGVGRLHYTNPAFTVLGTDDYRMVNYTWFPSLDMAAGNGLKGAIRDPERFPILVNNPGTLGFRAGPGAPQISPYVGGNVPYTYPDYNNFFLAAVRADGTVLAPSFFRNDANGFGSLSPTNQNWYLASATNPNLKYMVLRPRPGDHPTFPPPEDAGGDVKNLAWGKGGNDSIWLDLGAPVMTAPDGTQYKMLFAPLILDLDGRINLNTAGNILAYGLNSYANPNPPNPNTAQLPSVPHVSAQGWGAWEVNLAKVLYGDSYIGVPAPPGTPPQAVQGSHIITVPSLVGLNIGDAVAIISVTNPTNYISSTIKLFDTPPPPPGLHTIAIDPKCTWNYASGPVTVIDQEWTHLFTGKVLSANQTVAGKYFNVTNTSFYPTNPANTTIPNFFYNATNLGASFQHFYAPSDFNGLNETAYSSGNYLSTSQPLLPGLPINLLTNNTVANTTLPLNPFALFSSGYSNSSGLAPPTLPLENTNHPLLYSALRSQVAPYLGTRVFRAADMEPLLRPNSFANATPIDANASALVSDLMRLSPYNLGPYANSMRYRNLVTTLSTDLGSPGVLPYWYSQNGPPPTYTDGKYTNAGISGWAYPRYTVLPPNQPANPSPAIIPFAAPISNGVPFPTIVGGQPLPNVGNRPPVVAPPTLPNPSEFGLDWRAVTALALAPTMNGGFGNGRIRLNQPLPPYPHMGTGLMPPYGPAVPGLYGTQYNLTPGSPGYNPLVNTQFVAAQAARQLLANQIYRTLLALTGVTPAVPTTPAPQDLIPRRYLAQLAVNIVDFIDEDDISTPFNFYTTQDDPTFVTPPHTPAGFLLATQGLDDNKGNPAALATGPNPTYWVFGTELPKVVLSEVVAMADNPPPSVAGTGPVYVWAELYNAMQAGTGTNTQAQDKYRVPFYVPVPAAAPPGTAPYNPYVITIAQNLMQSVLAPGGLLPDISANVLGKADNTTTSSTSLLPQSTVTVGGDFCTCPTGAPLIGGGIQAANPICTAAGVNVGVGIDPQNYFLVGPPLGSGGSDPTAGAGSGIPAATPILRTPSLSYSAAVGGGPFWPGAPAPTASTDERTSGLTVMLRRLANPYLPPQIDPTIPLTYNPYITVDYLTNVQIQKEGTAFGTRVKRQPYASHKSPVLPYNFATLPYSPVQNLPLPPIAGTVTNNGVTHTFGMANALPTSTGSYDWLVHLDRQPISPMELLHVSGTQPHLLTQLFVAPPDAGATGDNNAAINMFHHYVPWLDYAPNASTAMTAPWWFDPNPWLPLGSLPPLNATLTTNQTHRLYRLFEFLECGDRAAGVWGQSRIPGKVNINTIWDAEILQALIDGNPTIGITANPPHLPLNATDPVAQIFTNMIASRSPSYANGSVGVVNTGYPTATATNPADDRPFWPLSIGLIPAGGTQFKDNGLNVQQDTLLRMNPNATASLLFQNPLDPVTGAALPQKYMHPYLQTQILNKLYNNVTTRSNTFAVFLTVGFFQVTNAATTPPTLGPEIGRSEGRHVRHRMFAIVDRTNLNVFSTTFMGYQPPPPAVPGLLPITTVSSATGPQSLTVAFAPVTQTTPTAGIPAITTGMTLVFEPGTDNEETVTVTATAVPNQFQGIFNRNHAIGVPVILRGNPGPWTLSPYDPRKDPLVVRYYSIID